MARSCWTGPASGKKAPAFAGQLAAGEVSPTAQASFSMIGSIQPNGWAPVAFICLIWM
jgi:hypothetical protein